MKIEKIKFNKLTNIHLSYLAGFLEADGCILVQIVKNKTYKYKHTIRFSVVFYQKKDKKWFFMKLKKLLGVGTIRERNDFMLEYTILGSKLVAQFLQMLLPFLILKKKLANLTLSIIEKQKNVQTEANFLEVCQMVDKVAEHTYSKNRKNTSLTVACILKSPVETEK